MLSAFLKPIRRFRKSYLPGIVTASADEDPSTLSTYSVIGATTRFSQLWLLLISTPLLIAVHSMTARIGDVTKKGLILLLKENFGRKIAATFVIFLVAANLLTLVGDIIGMAAGFQLLTGDNYLYFIIPIVILVWYLVVFDSYKKIAKYFFWFSAIMLVYILAGFLAKPDWLAVLRGLFIPKISYTAAYALSALGLFGVTFSPYALVWQTEEEIEEHNNIKKVKQSGRGVILGFIYSSLISFFVIVACSSAIMNGNLDSLTVRDVAMALTPVAGKWAAAVFGIGLIGSGILAIPILAASSAYAITELFDLPQGLNQKPKRAKVFYALISFGFLFCLAALLFDLDPIKAMFFSQVLVGAITPFFIYFILRIAGNKKLMGEYCCHWLGRAAGWLTIILLLAGDILVFYFLSKGGL